MGIINLFKYKIDLKILIYTLKKQVCLLCKELITNQQN